MLYIHKITSHPTVDFAAEELKKYFRMMMPKMPDVKIAYAPGASDGFRLGLMQDFGLDLSDVMDASLDDAVYIETDETGGVLAGSNLRSILFAVYELLKQNGCRWLYPGVDGEYIPLRNIHAVSYRHVASSRYRGPCIEGAVSQSVLLNFIDFLLKAGLNVYKSQFFHPSIFFKRYYGHSFNELSDVFPSESITNDNVLQWKTVAEVEIAKRSLMYEDIGHGWTSAPFGFDTSSAWAPIDDSDLTEEDLKYMALYKGERKLYHHTPLATQFCMSSPEARKIVVDYIADYAEAHPYVGVLQLSLGDAVSNHCECELCSQKHVSDFYVMMMNELDEVLTARNIHTRLGFSAYHDTLWAPLYEQIKNPDRFVMQLAPITRSYMHALSGKPLPTPPPFQRNNNPSVTSLDAFIPFLRKWQEKAYSGDVRVFEYHFWRHQHFELSGLALAKRIFEDIETYSSLGFSGMIACGSLRSFFPNGFAYYVYARKLFDETLTFEALTEDFFSHAYGEQWRDVYAYLEEIYDYFGFGFLEGEESKDASVSPYYDPERAKKLSGVRSVTAKGKALAKSMYPTTIRTQILSARLLAYHAEYSELLADALIYKANGQDSESMAAFDLVRARMSAYEPFLEPYFDFFQTVHRILDLLKERGSATQIV